MIEKWKQIQGTTYEVSDRGRVRREDGKILKSCEGRNGYLHVGIRAWGKKHTLKIHYLVCVTFNGVRPMGAECVRHLDGDNKNNVPSNLRWGTNLENAADTILHGRQVCGFDHPNVHIKKKEARAIRESYKSHMVGRKKAANGFVKDLASEYPHLGFKCVYKACRGAYDEME